MDFSAPHGRGLYDQRQAKGGDLLLEDIWGGALFLLVLPCLDIASFSVRRRKNDQYG